MRKILATLLLLAALIGLAVPAVSVKAANSPTIEEAVISHDGGPSYGFLLVSGTPVLCPITFYRGESPTGSEIDYPAYCLHPYKDGPDKAGSYAVSTKNYVTNPQLYGIIANGYPYKTPAELGVATKEQAFYATAVAVWSYVAGWSMSSFTAADESQEATLAAMKAIYTAGMAVESIPVPLLTSAPTASMAQLDSIDTRYASQTFTVSANMDIRSYEVFIPGNAPIGTRITDINSNPKSTFATGEQFKILIPADQISEATGAFEIGIVGELKSHAIIYGLSYNQEVQDFGLTRDPFTFEDATATVSYASSADTGSDDVEDPPSGGTLLEIIKIASGTRTPLPGAVFRVTSATNGVVGTFVTGNDGRAIVSLNRSGAYYIEEIIPPKGYVLSDNPHQDVVVVWQQTTTVTFTNEKAAAITINKVDADSGQKLRGATIRVARDGGAAFVDVTTDVAGSATITDLEPGTYSVTEIVAPEGYILNSTPQTVILESGKTSSITLTNRSKPGLVIRKYDEDTGVLLSGAEFSVAKKGGSIVYEGITNSTGTIRLEDLDEGWYSITELAAPKGYLIATESKDVYLEANKTVEVKFDNRLRPSLRITKVDSQTNRPLAGAVFQVMKAGGGTVSEYITDSTGSILINDLDEAIYSVTEVQAPDGYLLDPQHKDTELQRGRITTLIFTNKAKPALEILKIDEETGKPLAGAKFRVTATEGGTVSEYITDAFGRILMTGLNDEIYNVDEIVAPSGYLLETQHKDIKLEWGETKRLIFTNKARPALEILKVDEETGLPLAGAKFRVTATEGGTVSEYITDSSGRILITDLDDEIYTVEEIVAPAGYLLEAQHKDIKLEWGKTKQLVFTNKARPALEIQKIDEATKEPLRGAKFRVTATESKTTGEYVTDNYGRIHITGLNEEIYTVEEIVAPFGYLLEPQHKDIQLEWGKTKQLVFTNKERPALEIMKIDTITGQPLSEARFKVTKTEDLTVSEYVTDVEGRIFIPNLDEAVYTVEEIVAPDGYILDAQKKEIQLEWGKTKSLIYEDTRKPTLIITKSNALTFEPIPNTAFKIEYEGANGGVQNLGSYRTDENGQIILSQVNPGWYIITETQAAPGFSLSSNPVTRKYLAPGENAYTKFNGCGSAGDTSGENIVPMSGYDYMVLGEEILDYPLNSIVIRKVNAVTGELLPGAVFTLRRVTEDISGSSGTLIGRYTTDNSGTLVITGLQPGGYIVAEVQAPINYLLSENAEQQAWLKSDGTSIVETTFANWPYGAILITKVDAQTNKTLPNARFRVTDSSGAVLGNTSGEYITDENGEILIPNVKPGSYVITEIEAPEYYTVDTTPQTVSVGLDGKIYKVSFKNQPSGTLQIRKMDSLTKAPLEGAEFKMTDSSGAVVGTGNGIYKTDASGVITIPNLAKGSYIVQEIKAPSGYVLDQQSQTIAVDYGKTYTLDFFNKQMSGLQIIKLDSQTKLPLKHAKFTVYTMSGETIGHYETDADGVIIIDQLEPGWIKIVETKAPDGYLIDDIPRDVLITANQFVQVVFENNPLSGLLLRKLDANTLAPLSGAEFSVKTISEQLIGNYRSDADGTVFIPEIEPGWYTVSETNAPDGYALGDSVQTVEIAHSKLIVLEFRNQPLGSIVVKKVDSITGAPLIGAEFTVKHQNGIYVGDFTTGSDGSISIPNVETGWYVIAEARAPQGYALDSTAKTIEVKPGLPTVTTFANRPYSGIKIIKTDAVTHAPLSGATFVVERANGERIGTYKTDASGKALITDLSEGVYVVSETIAPDGYTLTDTPKTVTVVSGKLVTAEFTNMPYSSIIIKKTDEISGTPLAGAEFTVKQQNGAFIGEFVTGSDGAISIPSLEPGWYLISETKAPAGYSLNNTAKTVEVTTGLPTVVTFTNRPYSGIEIVKVDAITHAPLSGATFVVERANGEKIGTYKTDAAGKIVVSDLQEGTYIISETIAPAGYTLDEIPKTVVVNSVKLTAVEFTNRPVSGIEIIKLDESSKAPLQGATFTVERLNGERMGTYKTDWTGKAIVSGLEEGTYIVSETIAPNGYILDEAPRTVMVTSGKLTSLEFTNKSLGGLRITKLNSASRQPIEGVEFSITKMNGENLGTFKTNKLGTIHLSALEPGWYTVVEMKAASGYFLDSEPHNVEIKWGKYAMLEITNTPVSSLLIIKTDATTNKPLPGAKFEVMKANGEKLGIYTTDISGRIYINEIHAGKYLVVEAFAPSGYELDTTAREITVYEGKQAVLEIKNTPQAGLRLLKIDSITKQPIFNVEFMVFDANSKHAGTFYTDNNGLIDFSAILPEGRYTIRETRAAAGYYLDETPKTVEFTAGKVTEIRWENTPQMGQIQIVKKSGDDNEVTGLPAGTPLAGAIFEAVDYRTGNLVDRFISGSDGRAVSQPLPLGRYLVREVQAPQWHILSAQELEIEIEFATQIVKREFLNYSANTGVTIRKTGNIEAMSGDTIRYDIKSLQNTSTVPLTDFYWRDVLPVDAVRLNKIVTGTYSQALKYKIIATTNKGDTKVIADNLSTTKNNVIDCSNAALGLRSDEFVTCFTFVFGNVKAGFALVEQPQVFVTVQKNLPNGYQFANKADIGGKYGDEWVVGNSSWTTSIYANYGPLPKTGY